MYMSCWNISIGDRKITSSTVEHYCRELSSSYGTAPFRQIVFDAVSCLIPKDTYGSFVLNQALEEQWLRDNAHLLQFEVFFAADIVEPQYYDVIAAFLQETYAVTLLQTTRTEGGMFSINKTISGYALTGDVRVWSAFYWGVYLVRAANNSAIQENPTIQSILDAYVEYLYADEDGDDDNGYDTAVETVDSYAVLLEGKEPDAAVLFVLNVGPIYGYETCQQRAIPYYAIRNVLAGPIAEIFQKMKEYFHEINI